MTEQPAHQTMGRMPARHWLCLGGSFNPIHIGHLICARHAAESAGLDGVRFVPAAANPHKGSVDLAAAEHRLAMCRLAVDGDPYFEVDPIEIERAGPSYTISTAEAFRHRGESQIHWAIGTDHVARLHQWHRFDDLVKTVHFVLMRRAAEPFVREGVDARIAGVLAEIVEVPQIEVSSTAIRQRVRAGRSIAHLVPPAVARYMAVNGLYR